MWSKRRRKFRKKYCIEDHKLYLLQVWFHKEFKRRWRMSIDLAFLYGTEYAIKHVMQTMKQGIKEMEKKYDIPGSVAQN